MERLLNQQENIMQTNKITLLLKTIAILVIVVGIIISIYINYVNKLPLLLSIGVAIGGIILGVLLLGISEIINLLQKNTITQEQILFEICNNPESYEFEYENEIK